MQHVVAMIIGCITPAIVISVVANVSPEDTMLLIQASLVTAAIATFIQLYPVAGRVGAGIPVVMGVSFAYVPVLIAIGGSDVYKRQMQTVRSSSAANPAIRGSIRTESLKNSPTGRSRSFSSSTRATRARWRYLRKRRRR